MAEPILSHEGLCFVICPIGSDGSDSRRRSDKLLKYVIKPVLESEGFKVERADQLAQPGIITNQIVRKVIECDILIADLSDGNPNVFYELAIRHGSSRPFVHMIESKEKIPFDNAQVRTIQFDLTDLDSVDKAKVELTAQVRNIKANPTTTESPLTFALDIDSLRKSPNADEQVIAAIYREVTHLRKEVRSLANSKPLPLVRILDEQGLISALHDSGYRDLAKDVEESVVVDDIEWGRISFSTSLSAQEDERIADQLKSALFNITGKNWEIDYIPF